MDWSSSNEMKLQRSMKTEIPHIVRILDRIVPEHESAAVGPVHAMLGAMATDRAIVPPPAGYKAGNPVGSVYGRDVLGCHAES